MGVQSKDPPNTVVRCCGAKLVPGEHSSAAGSRAIHADSPRWRPGPRVAIRFRRPNGLEMSRPAEAGNASTTLGQAGGHDKLPGSAARRVGSIELIV